jgi:ABC-type transport system substrate-binding protein
MAEVPGGWNTGLDKNPERIPVNGPYRVSAWEQGQSLTLERNDRYFGPKAATAPLEQAGYAKGADGIYAKDGRPLSLRISTTAGNQLRETQEQLIQAQLKQIGVDIKIVNADSTKFFGEWLPQGNFDIANVGWVGNPFAISSSQDIYRTGGGGNYGAYESRKSTTCSPRRSGRSTRPGRPSSATRSTSSSPPTWPPSRCTPSRPTWPCATASPTSATTPPRKARSGTPASGPEGGRAGHRAVPGGKP